MEAHLEGVLAQRDTWVAAQCSIDRAMRAIGNRSTLLLLREAFYGARRFDEFARRVGITEAVAAARLKELVAVGVFERQPYQEPGQRTRHEYVLTDTGRDLLPVGRRAPHRPPTDAGDPPRLRGPGTRRSALRRRPRGAPRRTQHRAQPLTDWTTIRERNWTLTGYHRAVTLVP
jgi:DNA-binding HxlR family transcriptional regulator